MIVNTKQFTTKEVRDVDAKITFQTATTLTGVVCTLRDSAGAIVGSIDEETAAFQNSVGTTASSTTWIVSFELDIPGLALSPGSYVMDFDATRADGRHFDPQVLVVIT